MTSPDNHLQALGLTTLATLGGLGVLAFMHQDAPTTTAWRAVFDDGSKLANSVANAIRETVAFGRRFGGPDDPTLVG